jgi:preprotein translocase SecE subunit
MSVAEKTEQEAGSPSPFDRLPISSLVGAAFVLGSIGIVFYLLPPIFNNITILNSFVTGAIQIVAMLAAAGGLIWLGYRLSGGHLAHGLKAGIFVCILGLALIALLTWSLGEILEKFALAPAIGAPLTIAAGIALTYFAGRRFVRPDVDEKLIAIEDQGWFNASAYKKSQGLRVRRGTVVGLLAVAFCGIWTLVTHKSLEGLVNNMNAWVLWLPFSGGQGLVLLQDIRFTVPILLTVGTIWFAYRAVNWPTFADFLIATEAEMNKVSWTTRKRLVQDTMVVLVTVFLFTLFLFVVDVSWGWILSRPVIGVLKTVDHTDQPEGARQPW